jgi:ABC-type dipeptide/oligopeptide/nickel transport system permease subunit
MEPIFVRRSEWRLALVALARDRVALAGVLIILAVIVSAVAAPWISPYDPDMPQRGASRLAPPLIPGHLLGTDDQGRDVLSRLIWGARIAIPTALTPILTSSVVGLAAGLVAGYVRGVAGGVIMRMMDVIFAFPAVLLAVAIAAILGPGIANAVIAMSIVLLPFVARIVYVETVKVSRQDFVEAARVCGSGTFSILMRDILPNILSPVIVFGTTSLGAMLVLAAGLSFLGVGVQPPKADWGVMAAAGRTVLSTAPWVSLVPGVVIIIVAVACNFAGDGVRDALDPRQRVRR